MLRFWADNFIPVALLVSERGTFLCFSIFFGPTLEKKSIFMHHPTHTSDVLLVLQRCFSGFINTILVKKNKVFPRTGNFHKISFHARLQPLLLMFLSKGRSQVGPRTPFLCPLRVFCDGKVV